VWLVLLLLVSRLARGVIFQVHVLASSSFFLSCSSSVTRFPFLCLQGLDSECQFNESTFKDIYENKKIWGGPLLQTVQPSYYYTYGEPERLSRPSLSGGGSNIGLATTASLKFLQEVIVQHNITSVFDIPCGDVNWQFEAWEMDSLPVYVGADVVPNLIKLNKRRFRHHRNKHFVLWDFSVCNIPNYVTQNEFLAFDLIHARDVFQHMPLDRLIAAVDNIRASEARYLICTTWPDSKVNVKIEAGSTFRNNMEIAPFYLKPLRCVDTHPTIEPDKTCLFELSGP